MPVWPGAMSQQQSAHVVDEQGHEPGDHTLQNNHADGA